MMATKKLTAAAFVSLLVLAVPHGMNARLVQEQNSKQGQATASQDETRILVRAIELQKDNKTEEALAMLYEGMDQFPASAQILNGAVQIYLAERRYVEAFRLLDERAKNFPE
ncbi:MAG: hypothetical protein MZU79_04300 [Anaerotruncus sp.]|nr:hypothetical protein [Anaerotruncus sp.]